MKTDKKQNFFVQGAIKPMFIGESIAKHSSKTGIGGHSIFLGQVRNDVIDGKQVTAIDYAAYQDMANPLLAEIRESLFSRYDLSCAHIYHSLGRVEKGEICLFVFVSAPHRRAAIDACNELVEQIKLKIPIFGKEIFSDESYVWKENKM